MKKKIMILCITLIVLLNMSFSVFSAPSEGIVYLSGLYTDHIETAEWLYRANFVLDMEKYPSFKDTWLYELSEDNKLELEFLIENRLIMRIFGSDGEILVKDPHGTSPWDVHISNADETKKTMGIYIVYSPYLEGWYEDTGASRFEWFSEREYRTKETPDEELRKKYKGQHFIMTLENNDGDKRIKFWGVNYGSGELKSYSKVKPDDELFFDYYYRPTTEIIRIDKEDTFTERGSENAEKRAFNDNEEFSYYRGCEGYDGEYEWVNPPESEIWAGINLIDENGNKEIRYVERTDKYDNKNYTYNEAIAYIKEHYPPVPVTDPISEPDLTPPPEDPRKAELREIERRYPSDEYYILDKDLKAGNKKENINQYAKYKDSDGNVHKIIAVNGKVSYQTYKGELVGASRFKIYNKTAAWLDKISSNGWANVEIRHYNVDVWVDEFVFEENKSRYFMRVSGDKGEQWYYNYNTYSKNKFDYVNETIEDTSYKTKTDEGFYLFMPISEFSESYIDLYSGNERNLEVILKFENEDKLEFENITIKRSGAEVDTVESEDVLADLGFRLHFFNDAYNEDGSFYEEYLPDDYDRLMKAHKEYSKKYKDVEIDVNSPFEQEEEKEEETVDPNKEIEVFVDGKKLEFDVAPIIVDDRTLVPMRAIFENLGAKVEWFGETRTVVAKTDDVLVSLQIGSKLMYKNNIPTELEVPAMLHNSRTLVPLRAVSEAFGKTVEWNAQKRTVTIY